MTGLHSTTRRTWWFALRVVVKAAILFVVANAAFALCDPLDRVGHLTLYNHAIPGRARLPYGEDPARAFNVTLDNIPAMVASHTVSRGKPGDEFRVLVLGDSSTWGWLLRPEETLAARITARGLRTDDGRRVVAYNLGYPGMSLLKDLVVLDAAMDDEPDLVVWLVTLESFPRDRQIEPALVQANPGRARRLIGDFSLGLDPNDSRFDRPGFFDRTIVGSRRQIAGLLRLQTYGFSWAATGDDIAIAEQFTPRQSDFAPDASWRGYDAEVQLGEDKLAFDVIAAGIERAGAVPAVIVNEPIFVSAGKNSYIRYNSFYPRWAYDAYRQELARVAAERGWRYLDCGDRVAPDQFTDTPVHLTPGATDQVADLLANAMLDVTAP